MVNESAVSQHYTHGDLLGVIQASLVKLGKSTDNVTVADLAPVDEFHTGGRIATENLLSQLGFDENDHLLDVGCGLGGAARFVADRFRNRVTGIDLTQEYIDTGNALCSWVGLDGQVTLRQGSALAMPFEAETFDGAYMLHVGMNIEDKTKLFAEINRVLRSGARFGIFDMMRTGDGELSYPVPWANEPQTSRLATPEQYQSALAAAGFEVSATNNRRDFAIEFFKQLKAKAEAHGGPPPIGLHLLMQDSTPVKVKNMVDNIVAGIIAPVEIIARKV
jgi:ubiquinone/menaquinone biosynthesis C-methylase UbiE